MAVKGLNRTCCGQPHSSTPLSWTCMDNRFWNAEEEENTTNVENWSVLNIFTWLLLPTPFPPIFPQSPPHNNKGKNNVARLTSHVQTWDTATSESPWTYILLTYHKQHDTRGCSKPLPQSHADHIPVHDSTLWKTKSRSRARQWTDYNSTQDTQQACDEQISSTGAEILAERANATGHIYI